jgi:large-conductance mechanosensitive channel
MNSPVREVEEKGLKEFREFAVKGDVAEAAASPKPAREEELPTEIRDLLKKS